MSDTQIQESPRRQARAQLRADRARDRQQTFLAPLIAQIEHITGKRVARLVVHYADKTQDTLRQETPDQKLVRRTQARHAARQTRTRRSS